MNYSNTNYNSSGNEAILLSMPSNTHNGCISLTTKDNFTNYNAINKPQLTSDKQWASTIYAHNKNTAKSLLAVDLITPKLMDSYFNLCTKKDNEKITPLAKIANESSVNKILSSKTEVKHLNDKAIVSINIYDRNSKVINYEINNDYSLLNHKWELSHLNKQINNQNTNISLLSTSPYIPLEEPEEKSKKEEISLSINIAKSKLDVQKAINSQSLISPHTIAKKKNNKKFLKKVKSPNKPKYLDAKIIEGKNNFIQDFHSKQRISKKHNELAKKRNYLSQLVTLRRNKAHYINYTGLEASRSLSHNAELLSFFPYKMLDENRITKFINLLREIKTGYGLDIGRKNYITELIRSNLVKKHKKSSLLDIWGPKVLILPGRGWTITNREYPPLELPGGGWTKSRIDRGYIPLELQGGTPPIPLKLIGKETYSPIINTMLYYRKVRAEIFNLRKILYLQYTQKLAFNSNKLKNWFILGMKSLISRMYNKKVELNIVNLKYLYLNSHNLIKSVATKLKNRKNKLLKVLKETTEMINLPSLQPYSYKQEKLSLKRNTAHMSNVKNYLLRTVKHRDVNGVTVKASGRLSKRITASRSVSKVKHKGSLKCPKSNINRLSVVAGHQKSNVQYSRTNSKTAIGSFGLKLLVSSFNFSSASS